MIIQKYVKLMLLLKKTVQDTKDTTRPLFQIPCHILKLYRTGSMHFSNSYLMGINQACECENVISPEDVW